MVSALSEEAKWMQRFTQVLRFSQMHQNQLSIDAFGQALPEHP